MLGPTTGALHGNSQKTSATPASFNCSMTPRPSIPTTHASPRNARTKARRRSAADESSKVRPRLNSAGHLLSHDLDRLLQGYRLVDAPPRLLHWAGRIDRVLRLLDAFIDILARTLGRPLGFTAGEDRDRPEQQYGETRAPVYSFLAHVRTFQKMPRFKVRNSRSYQPVQPHDMASAFQFSSVSCEFFVRWT